MRAAGRRPAECTGVRREGCNRMGEVQSTRPEQFTTDEDCHEHALAEHLAQRVCDPQPVRAESKPNGAEGEADRPKPLTPC